MVFHDLLPCLEKSYQLLKIALNNEVVFITGPPSTGKTTLAKQIFQEDEYKDLFIAAYVDCYSISSPNQLFSTICQAYHEVLGTQPKGRSKKKNTQLPEPGIESVNQADFPRYLDGYYKIASEQGYKCLYIILDHVEVFEKTNMMDSFVAICRALNKRNFDSLRLIVVTYETPMDIVQYITQKSSAIGMSFQDRMQVVSCNAWSREDTIDWILKLPPKREEELYRKFVKHIVALVYISDSRDPRQIRMYCQQTFQEFLNFYQEESKRQVRKELKLGPDDSIDDEIMDDFSFAGSFCTIVVQQFLNSKCTMIDKRRRNFKWTHEDTEIKMPINTQILIVAAYIAAYSKPANDKLNFVTLQKKKKSRPTRDPEHINRAFTLERLIHIFLSLVKTYLGQRKLEIIDNNDCLLADIERLENLNILHHQGGHDLCSDTKYRLSLNIKRDYVKRLADNVDLNLDCINGLQPE